MPSSLGGVEDLERDCFILNPRLMKDKTWAWCVQELRDKAVSYKEHGHIRVLDTGSCICKTESAELQSISSVFRLAVRPLACQYELRRERQEQRKLLKADQMDQVEPEEYEDGGPRWSKIRFTIIRFARMSHPVMGTR